MRVCILTTASFPDGLAATARVRCYARALQESGHEVEIVAPSNRKPVPGGLWSVTREWEGMRLTILHNAPHGRNRWSRLFWSRLHPLLLLLHAIGHRRKADRYIIFGGTVLPRFFAIIALKMRGRRVVLELNERPYSAEGSRFTRLPGVKRVLRWFVLRHLLPQAHGVLVISHELDRLAAHAAPKVKRLLLPILMERPVPEPGTHSSQDSSIYLFHAGTLSEGKDGIVSVFRAFAHAHAVLRDRFGVRLKFVLTNRVTLPATWAQIIAILTEADISDEVIVTGYCSEGDLQRWLAGALALVVNKPHNPQNAHNFPTKLAQYLASRRPVILAAEATEANRYLTHLHNALVVRPDDSPAIAAAILLCYEDKALASAIGERGSATAAEHFFYARHADRMSSFLGDL